MAIRNSSHVLPLGSFLNEVQLCLDSYTTEDLRQFIHQYARTLPASQRFGFLQWLKSGPKQPDIASPEDDYGNELLEEIDEFIERLASGEYYEYWGWDRDIHDERAFGDETWVEEMDALLEAAAECFIDGNYELAAQCYGRLLPAFCLGSDEETVFCGPDIPERMVQTNLAEAKARYFRAVYLTTPIDERVETLLTAVEEVIYVDPAEVGLRDVIDCEQGSLPDLSAFLPAWIEALKRSRKPGRWLWDNTLSWLLTEAVNLHGGTEGLGKMAGELGQQRPELYAEWIAALVREHRLEEAITAAQQGVEQVQEPRERARLADTLAELAAMVGKCGDETRLLARKTAWKTEPTWWRLIGLYTAGQDLDVLESVLDEAATEAEKLLTVKTFPESALACGVLLLAGRVDKVIECLINGADACWDRGDSAGPVVVPYLLQAASNSTAIPPRSALAALWRTCNDYCSRHHQRLAGITESKAVPAFSELACDALQRHAISADAAAAWLDTARRAIEERVNDIVSSQYRAIYRQAAELCVAYSEVMEMRGEADRGTEFVTRVRNRFPRHRSFHSELDGLLFRAQSESQKRDL